jgi:hypothetical protein
MAREEQSDRGRWSGTLAQGEERPSTGRRELTGPSALLLLTGVKLGYKGGRLRLPKALS